MQSKGNIERTIKIIGIVLLITLFISFVFSVKYSDHKVYGMIFYSSLLIMWALILIIPRTIFTVIQSIWNNNEKREIYKYEIWIYRIIAICWMISCIFHIRVYMDL
ncbi:hypothetical protein [Crassaminicella profunda]|uniref:hypothetical protein n=1 Tax=Crassaminicella profunda TaxID=1286698 RepID=UPI001CA6875C|nr:hypothetical protein [Crassaminicella profunda]QZY55993.1 hypothetical protein K7H06_03040 [Crassaminicella profunda]